MRILLPLQYEGADGRFSGIVIDDIDRELEDLSTVMGVRLRFIEEEPLGVNDPRSSRPVTTMIWVDMTPLNDAEVYVLGVDTALADEYIRIIKAGP